MAALDSNLSSTCFLSCYIHPLISSLRMATKLYKGLLDSDLADCLDLPVALPENGGTRAILKRSEEDRTDFGRWS